LVQPGILGLLLTDVFPDHHFVSTSSIGAIGPPLFEALQSLIANLGVN